MDVKSRDIIVNDAVVHFKVSGGLVRAVDHVSAVFESGRLTGIVGESGCGKSVLGLGIFGLLPSYAIVSGEILFSGVNTLTEREGTMRSIRGKKIGLIPQNPGDSLNPVRRAGVQLEEAVAVAEKSREKRRPRALKLLSVFGFPDPAPVMKAYPFELSGGMQQRVLCAVGTACSPPWLLADEPTKGLDAALREQVYETLSLAAGSGTEGMLVITHDLVLARKLCDVLAVMYGGEIVEMGSGVLEEPLHPYTRAFISSLPENGMNPMPGLPPSPEDDLPGCKFAPRCPYKKQQCENVRPGAFVRDDRTVRCFLYA